MAAARTAQYLVDRTRFHTGVFDKSVLRDGFDADRGEADRAILPALNEAIQKILRTGQFKCRFQLGLISGIGEYVLDPGIGEVDWVTYQNNPIDKSRMTTLDRREPGWRLPSAQLGAPRYWYNDMPDVIGLVPIPSGSDPTVSGVATSYSLMLLAEALTDDLVYETDIPQRLPSQFHDELPVGAACIILASFGDPLSLARRKELMLQWDNPRDPSGIATLQRVQALAQARERGEAVQMEPLEYRENYGAGTNGWGGSQGWY